MSTFKVDTLQTWDGTKTISVADLVGKTGDHTMAGVLTAGGLLSNAGVIGYAPGAGGTVVQATSKSTAVVINKPSGKITMHDAALAAGASVSFSVTNSLANGSPVLVVGDFATINPANYRIETEFSGYGSFSIKVTNISGAGRSEALVISFAMLKRVAS